MSAKNRISKKQVSNTNTTQIGKAVGLVRGLIVGVFHLLLLVVPLFFLPYTSELFEFNKLLVVYASAIILTTLWMISMTLERRVLFRSTPFDWAMLAFVLSQLISTILSIHPQTSIFGYYSRFNGGLLSVLSYTIITYAGITFLKKTDLRSLSMTLVYGALLSSLYAIPEHFGHSPSCLLITGSFDVACWVQAVQLRVFGTFGQPNWLAGFLVGSLMVTGGITLGMPKNTRWWKIAALLLSLCAQLMAFYFTKSRSGLIALTGAGATFASLLSFIFLLFRKHADLKSITRSFMLRSTPVVIILLFTTMAYGSPVFEAFSDLSTRLAKEWEQRLLSSSSSSKSDLSSRESNIPTPPTEIVPATGTQLEAGGSESGEIRRVVWSGAIDVWRRYPWFGSGVETFGYSYFLDRPLEHNSLSEWDFVYNKAHNELLNYLATTGAIGFASYLILHLLLIAIALNTLRSCSFADATLLAGWTAGMIGIHLSNFFGFSTVPVSLLMTFFPIVIILAKSSSDSPPNSPLSSQTRSLVPEDWILIIPILGIGLLGLIWITSYYRADVLYAYGKQANAAGSPSEAVAALESAIALMPQESLYHDELSITAANLSVLALNAGESTISAQLAELAQTYGRNALHLNPVNLNIYKSQSRMFITLAQRELNQDALILAAIEILNQAERLAPRDPKLFYNRGLMYEQLGDLEQAQAFLQKAVELRPMYLPAQEQLERIKTPAKESSIIKE